MDIWYLGHSSWALKLETLTLIFDYGREPIRQENGKLEDGIVDLKNLEGDILFFVSHGHSDHYNKYIHKLSQAYHNIKFVLGNVKSSYSNSIKLKAHNFYEINGLKIYTSDSTDCGVSFLIDTGKFTIYHGGDNAIWEDSTDLKSKYEAEIDYISNIKTNIGISFLPIASFRNSISKSMLDGAKYAILKLKLKNVFPMHGYNFERLYDEFKKTILEDGFNTNIYAASYLGQKFIYDYSLNSVFQI